VNHLLRRIELAHQHHVRGREVANSFRFSTIQIASSSSAYEDGSLGFPFQVPHRSASTPTFLCAIRTAGFRVFGPTTLVADPTGPRCLLLRRRQRAECHETANQQENKNNPVPFHRAPFCLNLSTGAWSGRLVSTASPIGRYSARGRDSRAGGRASKSGRDYAPRVRTRRANTWSLRLVATEL
jgi:hypothetical protein